MKTIHMIIVAVTLLVAASPIRTENPGDFTVESPTHGTKFTLSQQKGKVVVLHFLLKTECPFCLRYTHDYAALAAKTPDIVHVFLKPDSAAEIKAWAGKISRDGLKGLPKIYRDPDAKLAKEFGIPDGYQFHGQVVHFPALVVLDGQGKELFRYVGKNNSDRMPTKNFTARLAATASKS
jgi:peroxiredoxin Q/BCP